MTPVYLGFLESLQSILQEIFDTILTPVLEKVFGVLVDLIGGLLWELLSAILLDLLIILLKIVNFINSMFKLFSGLAVLVYKPTNQEYQLLSYLFQMNWISKALAYMTCIAAVLAFIFAIYATGKSISDGIMGEGSRPISKIIESGIKSTVTFIVIPFFCILILQFSMKVMDQIVITFQYAQGPTGGMEVDDVLFLSAAESAAKNDDVLKKYKTTTGAIHAYQNRNQVDNDFMIEKIDFITGYISTIFIIVVLLGACLSFIRRCFDLLMLYLVSPFFAATIPLDGGKRFAKWRDMFVGNFFSGFGSIFAMKIYLILIPMFTNSSLVFSSNNSVNTCVKLFLIMGGTWAVYKGQNNVLKLISPEAARNAEQNAGAMVGYATLGVHMAVGRGKQLFNSFQKKEEGRS